MKPTNEPAEAAGLPPPLGQAPAGAEEAVGPPFVPLRLVLQPSGATIEVDRPDAMIGRHTEADIRLPLPDVSRRHCRLLFVEGCWQVIDLHSLNGVFVNGEQVLQAPLEQGDLLRVGGFTFAVDLSGGTAETSAAPAPGGHFHGIVRTLSGRPREARRRAS
jgi:pSer/pThr/pTyr-binding forkhead associated (FHA) protein